MAAFRNRHKRRRVKGVIPSAFQWFVGWCCSLGQHPQPLILFGLVLAAVVGLWNYAQRAEAFRITAVQLPLDSSLKLPPTLIGNNLWTVDIHTLAYDLKQRQPWLKEVRVIRQLPNTIRIEAIPRRPIAQVQVGGGSGLRVMQAGHWYLIDQEGFILPTASEVPDARLIRLTGFERGSATLKVGKENTDERILLALRVLKMIQHPPRAMTRPVRALNLSDPQQLRLLLDDGLEVRCGSEDELGVQLDRLAKALKMVERQRLDVQYIDVRFKEPVVAPRALAHSESGG